jgi:hypothetical protein
MTTAISEKAWSDYKKSDYSIAQWHQACVLHQHTGEPASKDQCKLPVRTPNGSLNRNGVHAAAAALAGARGGVQASPGQMATAKAALKKAYAQLDEQAPSSVQQSATSGQTDGVISHHGVKGMKWGVRHDPGHQGERTKTKKIAKLDKNFEKNATNVHTFLAIHNRAAQLTNDHDIDRINNKPKYKNADFTNDSPIRRQYYNEHQQAFLSNVRKAAGELGTNASGTRNIEIVVGKDGDWGLRTSDVKHADTIDYFDLLDGSTVHVFYDDMGHITRIEPPEELQQSAFDTNFDNFLIHYGVKGMHWGVRSDNSGGSSRRSKPPAEPPSEDAARVGQLHSRVRAQRSTKPLSNKELELAIRRMNLEQQYSKLSNGNDKTTVQKGRGILKGFLQNAVKVNASQAFNAQVKDQMDQKFKQGRYANA